MVPRLRSWWQTIKQHPFIAAGIIVALLALIVLAIAVVLSNGTGFNGYTVISTATETTLSPQTKITTTAENQPGKTLWDLLQLLAVLAIPIVVGFGAAWFTAQQGKVSERENRDNQRAVTLQTYLDRMSELLLEKGLRRSKQDDDEVRNVARAQTLTVLASLDADRKRSVLLFLYESGLLYRDRSIIDLRSVGLRAADERQGMLGVWDLRALGLYAADLSEANVGAANLRAVILCGAYLQSIDLSGCDLRGADLRRADLNEADLGATILRDANLCDANLSKADLSNADLRGAILSGASLSGVDLSIADLSGANLSGANLNNANLSGADLSGAALSGANLSEADLLITDLSRAIFSADTKLSGAYLSPSRPGAWPASLSGLLGGPSLGDAHLYPNGLVGADLRGAFLAFASLRGVDLNNVLLGSADLSGANLSGANLSGAHLIGTDLSDANLKDATGITTEELEKQAKSLKGATMPDGTKHS